jgi:hypothetical protein
MIQQMQKSQPIETLRTALNKCFPADKVEEILRYYNSCIHNSRLDNYAQSIVDAGKAVEAILKCLHYLRTQEVVDSIKVEHEVIQLEQCTSLRDSERMTIPRTLWLIYEHRNRRGAAHNNSFNPNQMDATFVISALKWVLGEMARLYLTSDPDEAQKLITNLLARDLPLVEEIDGSYLILRPDLPARIQLEILLYRHQPSRCQLKELITWIGNAHSEANIRVTLNNLKRKALVHENQDGWRLTDSGVLEAVKEITQIQVYSDNAGNHALKTKGTKHGRKR